MFKNQKAGLAFKEHSCDFKKQNFKEIIIINLIEKKQYFSHVSSAPNQ